MRSRDYKFICDKIIKNTVIKETFPKWAKTTDHAQSGAKIVYEHVHC